MDGKKVAIKSTSTRPWRDKSVYWEFGYYKDGKIHRVKQDSVKGEWENVVEGDYAMGLDEPSVCTPKWDELSRLVYDFVARTRYSVNVMEDYDESKKYEGLHCVEAH